MTYDSLFLKEIKPELKFTYYHLHKIVIFSRFLGDLTWFNELELGKN